MKIHMEKFEKLLYLQKEIEKIQNKLKQQLKDFQKEVDIYKLFDAKTETIIDVKKKNI
jgi:hypothetical protein